MMRTEHLVVLVMLVGATACDGDGDPSALRQPAPGTESPGPTTPADEPPPPGSAGPSTCSGRSFVGLGGTELTADRVVATAGVDRGRVKPFGVLAAEYERVLGATPASLADAADTFGSPPARWYEEAAASGVILQTGFAVAFDGCLTFTATAPEYAAAPTGASAPAACAAMARKFWSRTASPDQVAACVEVAVKDTADQPSPRRRWAYACASVLNTAGFTTF